MPTQRLNIVAIPLRKGRYRIARLDPYGTTEAKPSHYWLLTNGSGILRAFLLQDPKSSWLRVNRYDPASGLIDGQFALNLADTSGQTVRFSKGLFRVRLQ
ncbi:hypothetical protein GCM10028817_23220 [Spirosoma pomorum]